MSNLNPTFKPQSKSLSQLANGDLKRPILIQVYDWDKNSADDLIGQCETTFGDLIDAKSTVFTLLRPSSKKNPTKPRGKLTLDVTASHDYNYIDYLRGGCQVRLMVAIDFTGSNGDPRSADSLHFREQGKPNEYQQVIRSIGQIVLDYDTDKKCPVWGFGGKQNGKVSHCFSLAPPGEAEVKGVDGILFAYSKALDTTTLSGPTNFSEIIQTAAMLSTEAYTPTYQHYSILMIITDGVITDLPQTIDAIVQASTLPLSIIIVGVGAADFSEMDRLDGDGGGLRSSAGRPAKRDIVQFVPFRDFSKSHISKLAESVLAEVPGQMLSHFNSNGIAPMASRQYDPTAERKQ